MSTKEMLASRSDYAACHLSTKPIGLKNWQNSEAELFDSLHARAVQNGMPYSTEECNGSLMSGKRYDCKLSKEDVIQQAEDLIIQYYDLPRKKYNEASKQQRWAEILRCIESCGTYEHSPSELAFGAKTAWRNGSRCVGRIQWSKLQINDGRSINSTVVMFEAICSHIKYATNGGNLRSAITIFAPCTSSAPPRIWNSQYIRFAGYENADGSVLGDPASLEFTKICEKLGWKVKGVRSRFDVLPLVLSIGDKDPDLFTLPPDLVLQVPLVHPRYPKFGDLKLRWYALPAVTSMALNCGGIYYQACGFNGWYASTEIVRDLCDVQRYNLLKEIAMSFDLDTTQPPVFWKDQATAELNIAILHSYQAQNVTIVDQFSVAESFMSHFKAEHKVRGGCPADWVWVVPPMSSAITSLFHQEMLNYKLLPSYEYQSEPWLSHQWKTTSCSTKTRTKKIALRDITRAIKLCSKMMANALAKRVPCTILYATETGKSETFAGNLQDVFKNLFHTKVHRMDEYDYAAIDHESLVLVVTSTFGNGEPPGNGRTFHEVLSSLKNERTANGSAMTNSKEIATQNSDTLPVFSVFGLGSRAYPNYCAFAHTVDSLLEDIGGKRLLPVAKGDEMCGQEESFQRWSLAVFKAACDEFCIELTEKTTPSIKQQETKWSAVDYRLMSLESVGETSICEGLSYLHKREIKEFGVVSVECLGASNERTILARFKKPMDCEYTPGDHLIVYPENDQSSVDAILQRTNFVQESMPTETVVQLQTLEEAVGTVIGKKWKVVPRLPVCSVATALKYYIDISTPPSLSLLRALSFYVTSEADQNTLTKLSADVEAYEQWRETCSPSLVDLLLLLPSLTLPATLLLSLLPVLQPRYYSVSSSPLMYPDEVHLTVSVVKYSIQAENEEKVCLGLCSNWLKSLRPGMIARCSTKQALSFRMPSDGAAPIIMVGPGSGVAPFRGFWQQRSCEISNDVTKPRGEASLYFGCRTKAEEVFKDEVEQATKAGALTAAYTAFSREPSLPKMHVQHVLREHASQVYEQLCKQGGHLYVCGDIAMAEGVTKTLCDIIQSAGQLSADEAAGLVKRLKADRYIHEDIYGLKLRSSIAAAHKKQEDSINLWRDEKSLTSP